MCDFLYFIFIQMSVRSTLNQSLEIGEDGSDFVLKLNGLSIGTDDEKLLIPNALSNTPSSGHNLGEVLVASDLQLAKNTKMFGINQANQEHELIGLNEYQTGEQVEVGSETIPLCLNHKATTNWSTKNITANYKDENGGSHVDKVAYLSDLSGQGSDSAQVEDVEVDTGKKFNGQVVYSKFFQGNITASANAIVKTSLLTSNSHIDIISTTGYANLGLGTEFGFLGLSQNPIGSYIPNVGSACIYSWDYGIGQECSVYLVTNSAFARDNSDPNLGRYKVGIEYTKTALISVT
jgi:hypothetical protein